MLAGRSVAVGRGSDGSRGVPVISAACSFTSTLFVLEPREDGGVTECDQIDPAVARGKGRALNVCNDLER